MIPISKNDIKALCSMLNGVAGFQQTNGDAERATRLLALRSKLLPLTAPGVWETEGEETRFFTEDEMEDLCFAMSFYIAFVESRPQNAKRDGVLASARGLQRHLFGQD